MTKIKNFDALAVNEARKFALSIAEAGLRAVDTSNVLKKLVVLQGESLHIGEKVFSLKKIKRLIFIGIGKCAVESGEFFEELLGDRLTDGIVYDVKSALTLKKIISLKGTHPLSSNENVEASKKIVHLLEGLTKETLVIFLISGGGSSLLCLPENNNPEEDILLAKTLMKQGATIEETNIVRKHHSLVRGGFLAKYAYPAKVASLIFSDVSGNDIHFIASGPTVCDTTTIQDAERILEKYDILNITGIRNPNLIETPKEKKYFEHVHNLLALSNQTALLAMKEKANEFGFTAKIITDKLSGEAQEIGKMIAREISDANPKEVLLYGGETTVTMHGTGRGGRNLEVGLSALQYVKDDEIVVTISSDGHDNGAFGGAVCDTITKKAITDAGLSLEKTLQNNDSYPLFERIGNYLDMGDGTGSNVADLIIAMKF